VAKLPSKVLCDTNFLLLPIRFGIDIFTETCEAINDVAEFFVSSKVIDEITMLMKSAKPGFERELAFALKLAEECQLMKDDSVKEVDDSLIELALTHSMIIGTTDSELRQRAREAGVKVVYLRQKRYLVLDG